MPIAPELSTRRPVPRELRSTRAVRAQMAQYLPPSLWRRMRQVGRRLFVSFAKASAIFAGMGLVTGIIGHSHYDSRAAKEDVSTIHDLPERVELFDAEGKWLGAIPWGTTRRSVTAVEELPQFFIDALVWMEDRTFFAHSGVNWHGVARAVAHDAKTFSLQHGGSGITQQLAKMWKFGIPKNETAWAKFDRKFLEWCLARRIEGKLSKNEILLAYLNRIDFGGGFHGIHAAAEGFFGKLPKELTVEESATLISIIRGPGLFSPIVNPTACKKRRDIILREMVKAGKLEAGEAQRLCAAPLVTKYKEWVAAQKGSEELRLAARELKASGIPQAVLEKGGLRVTLTIDSAWDARSHALTQAHLARIDPRIKGRPLQGAGLVIETRTGEIKVLQSGRGLPGDQLDRVFQARRQAGSIAKPFTYELAFAQGIRPDEPMRNDEIAPGELWPNVNWSPRNAGDRGDVIPCAEGLIFSQNRATVRLGARVGLPAYGALLEKLGVCNADNITMAPSSLIGSFEARLADLTRAFTIFPLEGAEAPAPHIIREVRSRNGEVFFASSVVPMLVADRKGCQMTAVCLREVFTKGTAKSAERDVSPKVMGKTGSTNGARDCWFIGADDRFTCGIWVGCDTPTTLSGGSGAKFALPLWVALLRNTPSAQ